MKNTVKILALAACVFFQACDKTDENEPVEPFSFEILAMDENGESLLDPATEEGRYYIANIDVNYNGVSWPVSNIDSYLSEQETDPVQSEFRGLTLKKLSYYKPLDKENYICLSFGAFDGAADYSDMIITITWPNGDSHVIVYNRKYKKLSNGKTDIQEYIRINGEQGKTRIVSHMFHSGSGNPGGDDMPQIE